MSSIFGIRTTIWIRSGAVAVVLAAIGAVYWWSETDETTTDPYADMSDEEILAAAGDFYQSRPDYERPVPHSEVPEGLPDMRSETCGECHTAQYEEWKHSTHRRAWTDDAQFMEELGKARGEYDDERRADYGWMCVNCHTPMVNQLEELVVGLEDGDIGRPVYVDNPTFDEQLQQDAIGCATCHVEDGVVMGPRGDTDAPHPVEQDEKLTDQRNCTQCHQAQHEYPEYGLGCFFTTGDEWSESGAAEADRVCQDCHMPDTTRPLAEGYDVPERQTGQHYFGGSLIPKHPDYEDDLEKLEPIFGSGAVISLDAPPEADCNPDTGDGGCPPAVRVHNRFAGHRFPTGDPERHVDVEATVRNADGEVLATGFERIGSKYEWYPEIELLSDNRIDPGDSLYVDIDWPELNEPVTVEIEAHKYRMYKEDFEYHELEGRYVRGRRFHTSEWTVEPDGSYRLERIDDDFGERTELMPPDPPPENR